MSPSPLHQHFHLPPTEERIRLHDAFFLGAGQAAGVAVHEPGDFRPDGGVDEVVEEMAGVFEGEGVWVGEMGDYEGVEFGG